jgi:hypothetical protein
MNSTVTDSACEEAIYLALKFQLSACAGRKNMN